MEQQWLMQLSVKTAAAKRFITYCKADIQQQKQRSNFDWVTYQQAVKLVVERLEKG